LGDRAIVSAMSRAASMRRSSTRPGPAARVASEALFAPAFLKEWVMQGRPRAHPAFADYLGHLAQTPQPHPAPPMPPASRTAKEPQA
jgi:hypothetical protein